MSFRNFSKINFQSYIPFTNYKLGDFKFQQEIIKQINPKKIKEDEKLKIILR